VRSAVFATDTSVAIESRGAAPSSAPRDYGVLDAAKFVCAILILLAHYASERASFPALLDYTFSIYIVAVPFFYTCSGFLLFDRLLVSPPEDRGAVVARNVKRTLQLYLVWSLIYFPFVIANWTTDGLTGAEVLDYLHTAAVFTTYPTIWFLPSLAVAILVTYALSRRMRLRSVFMLALALYAVGALGYSYSFVQEWWPSLEEAFAAYNDVFITTRNGLFNGFPFVALGAMLASQAKRLSVRVSAPLALGSLALVVGEAVALRVVFGNVGADTVLALIPFTYFAFQFLLGLDFGKSRVYRTLRSMSVLVFVSQRLFLTALPSLMPDSLVAVVTSNSYAGLVGVTLLVLGFSYAVLRSSERIRGLRLLY